eukprot:SAG11_NODE_178_length_13331_cov_17.694906_6_plen_98_part_00
MYRYTSARSKNYQDLPIGGCTATYRYNPESGISQPDFNENPSVCVAHTPVENFVNRDMSIRVLKFLMHTCMRTCFSGCRTRFRSESLAVQRQRFVAF